MSDKLGKHRLHSRFVITPYLRWVIRDNEKILQQAWQATNGEIEWRDIPITKEDSKQISAKDVLT